MSDDAPEPLDAAPMTRAEALEKLARMTALVDVTAARIGAELDDAGRAALARSLEPVHDEIERARAELTRTG